MKWLTREWGHAASQRLDNAARELNDTELINISEECGGDDKDEVPEETPPAKNARLKNPWRYRTTFKAHRIDWRKLIQRHKKDAYSIALDMFNEERDIVQVTSHYFYFLQEKKKPLILNVCNVLHWHCTKCLSFIVFFFSYTFISNCKKILMFGTKLRGHGTIS